MDIVQKTLIIFGCKHLKEIRDFKKLFYLTKKDNRELDHKEIYKKCLWNTRVKEIEKCIKNLESIKK